MIPFGRSPIYYSKEQGGYDDTPELIKQEQRPNIIYAHLYEDYWYAKWEKEQKEKAKQEKEKQGSQDNKQDDKDDDDDDDDIPRQSLAITISRDDYSRSVAEVKWDDDGNIIEDDEDDDLEKNIKKPREEKDKK